MDELRTTIERFQKAMITRLRDDYEFELLGNFPEACCEFASLLLAKYLFESISVTNIKIILGENLNNPLVRHTWLEIAGQNVDITAQQFDKDLPKIVISDQYGWHKNFRIIKRERFNPSFMDDYENPEKHQIMNDYHYLYRNA